MIEDLQNLLYFHDGSDNDREEDNGPKHDDDHNGDYIRGEDDLEVGEGEEVAEG